MWSGAKKNGNYVFEYISAFLCYEFVYFFLDFGKGYLSISTFYIIDQLRARSSPSSVATLQFSQFTLLLNVLISFFLIFIVLRYILQINKNMFGLLLKFE